MPVPTDICGATVPPITQEIDARWTMAYAAALDDTNPRYFDTTADDGIVAHPLFVVCPEWPAVVSMRSIFEQFGLTANEVSRSVHATHDLTIGRLVRPGDVLTTSLEVVGAEQRAPGAFVTTRLTTVDARGDVVATTDQGGIYLGVPTSGPDRPAPEQRSQHRESAGVVSASSPITIAAGAAHTYTECARIWNPIHTDRAVAFSAGLPDLILHGTATLAHAVSRLVDSEAESDPGRVRRIVARFRAMVLMPSVITVRVLGRSTADGSETFHFDVQTEHGEQAIDRGRLVLERRR